MSRSKRFLAALFASVVMAVGVVPAASAAPVIIIGPGLITIGDINVNVEDVNVAVAAAVCDITVIGAEGVTNNDCDANANAGRP